jgi:hypothetical protein
MELLNLGFPFIKQSLYRMNKIWSNALKAQIKMLPCQKLIRLRTLEAQAPRLKRTFKLLEP